MAQTEEKELVLGNKQLLSVFFVAAILCGVFFAVGYTIGRNSAKTAPAAPTDAPAADAGARRQQPEPPRETPAATDTAPTAEQAPAAAESARNDGDKPAAEPKPAEVKPAEAKPAEAAPVEKKPAEPKPYTAREPAGGTLTTPEAGASYVQAISTSSRSDAESIAGNLREKSMKAIVAAGAKEGTFRVLVGPYRQNVPLSEAKQAVQKLGFGGAFVYKP